MARKLKTFVTSLGFFEQAVAAPSMKAALEAWGVTQNLFHQGFAKETDDPKIVAAATAQPGVVVKRAVGSRGAFTEDAALPTALPAKTAKPSAPAKKPAKAPKRAKRDEAAERAQAAAYEKTRAKRERDRAKEEAKQAAAEARDARKREADAAQARAALDAAQQRHEATLAKLERQRQAIERKIDAESDRWRGERKKLEARLRKAEG